MNGYKEIPITYMRGGTSKGAYLLKDTLPTDPAARDRMIFPMRVKLMVSAVLIH